MSSSKRDRSMFEAVQQLDSQDTAASLTTTRNNKDVERSKAAQSQTQIYHSLVECRILLQRSMTPPQQQADDNDKNKNDDISKAQEQCNQLLVSLLQARHKLLHPTSSNSIDYHKLQRESKLSKQIQSEYTDCQASWKNVLNRRHEQVRLHAGKTAFLKVLDASFWQQVESVTQYETLRQTTTFDDTKVYQQLLKDLLLSNNNQVPPERKSKKKKLVDRRASKGRKIRYTDISKLANFTFPLSKHHTSGLDEDEWFCSLFGGVGNNNNKSSADSNNL